MASFRDSALLELSDRAVLAGLLLPPGDTTGQRIRTMLAATYDLAIARVDQIKDIEVRSIGLQRPLFPVSRRTGQWSQTVPSYTRADLTQDVPAASDPVWADLLVELSVTLVTETDPGGAESVVAQAFEDFTTFDEFRQRFLFFDLDAFLAKHRITTVEQLRESFEYIVTEVQLRKPGPFDPNDPGNTRTLPVTVAALIVDPFDLAGGLRAAQLVRAAARGLAGAHQAELDSVAAYATTVVFSSAGLPGGGPTAGEVEQLYAREGVVSLFLN